MRDNFLPSEYLFYWINNSKSYLSFESWEKFREYGNYNTCVYDARVYDQRLLEVSNYLKKNKGCSILDVGCGVGNDLLYFAYCGAKALGIDINKSRLACAKERISVEKKLFRRKNRLNCIFENKNILDIKASKKFDVIWMKEAFHHLEPRDKILDKLKNVTRKEGYLFISESNALNPLIQLLLIKKRGINTVKEFTDEEGNIFPYGDERIVSPYTLKKILENKGFKVKLIKFFRVLPRRISYSAGIKFTDFIEETLMIERIPFLAVHYNLVAQKVV